jgi:hypothetical protein
VAAPRPTQESKDFKLGHNLNNGRVFVVGWHDSSRSRGPDRYQRQIERCDNLLFDLLSKKAKEHQRVLFEYIGSSLSDWRFPWSVRSRVGILANQCDLQIIPLTTPPQECVASYNALCEDAAREKGKALRPHKVDPVDDHRQSHDSARFLAASGLAVEFLTRDAAPKRVLELIRF